MNTFLFIENFRRIKLIIYSFIIFLSILMLGLSWAWAPCRLDFWAEWPIMSPRVDWQPIIFHSINVHDFHLLL